VFGTIPLRGEYPLLANRERNGIIDPGVKPKNMSIDDIPIQPDRQTKRPVGQIASVGISIVALVVSGFSLWESHTNSILQRELARPLLEISEAYFMTPDVPGGYPQITILATVKNVGHLTAVVTDFRFEKSSVGFSTLNGGPPPDLGYRCLLSMKPDSAPPTGFEEILVPGASYDVIQAFQVDKECARLFTSVGVGANFTYRDQVKNETYSQTFLLPTTNKRPPTNLKQ
jgi:hypothetical protein